MRLGLAWVPCAAAYYRAIDPAKAMARRGHELVLPPDGEGAADLRRLAGCDVVHVYRRCDEATRRVVAELVRGGTAVTYDNDDDFRAVPEEAPGYKKLGGLEGQRGFARSVKMAKLARVFTTTNELLAERYRRAGVKRTAAIGNYLAPDVLRPRHPHDGVVIGWIAGGEHQADVARIPIVDALRRVIARHDHVRVECIGVDLHLPERYRHDAELHPTALPDRIGGFDIGIAPLSDIPLNRTRSDIKLKEYAATGVPWLASPVGPYAGLGDAEGGRLVPHDGWFDALDELVTNHAERARLARNASAWAGRQSIETVAERWEQVFADAAGRRVVARPAGRGFTVRPGVTVRLSRPRG